jgi:hypothetical protein
MAVENRFAGINAFKFFKQQVEFVHFIWSFT